MGGSMVRSGVRALLHIGAVLLLSFPRAASGASWSSIGPDGGRVVALVRDPGAPSIVYASTGVVGVFRSTDGGTSWSPARQGLSGRSTGPIAAAAGGVLLVGTDSGLFRSADGAATWVPVAGEPGGAAISSLAIDPRSLGTAYVVGSLSGESAIWKTTDSGASWSRTSATSPPAVLVAVASDSAVFASSANGYVIFRSEDGGVTWPRVGGIPTSFFFAFPTAIVPDPGDPATLYVPTNHTGRRFLAGLFKSNDRGRTFLSADQGLAPYLNAIAFGLAGDLYAGGDYGLFVSRDRAASWQRVAGVPPSLVKSLLIGPPSPFLVGTLGRGVLGSADGGTTWSPHNVGLRSMVVASVALDPKTPSIVWAGNGDMSGGVFVSRDGGATWSEAGMGLPVQSAVESLAVDPSNSDRAYAAMSGISGEIRFGGGVFRTDDGGRSWQATAPMSSTGYPMQLAIDPADPARLYATHALGLYRTVDAGASWQGFFGGSSLPGRLSPAVAIDPEDPTHVFAGANRSGDRGATWNAMGWPLAGAPLALAVGPGGVLYAGAANGVLRSENRGVTFVPANRGIEGLRVETLAVAPRTGIVYAGAVGVMARSRDRGQTWEPWSDGLPTGVPVRSLAVDPTSGTVYAGTGGAGLYRRIEESPSCATGPGTACLAGGRFRAQVSWRTATGSGQGQAVPLTSDTAAFWFFTPNNIELVVKVVDGRAFNNKFWVFYGALSDVEYTITVTDTTTGNVKTYFNSSGQLASVADTAAF